MVVLIRRGVGSGRDAEPDLIGGGVAEVCDDGENVGAYDGCQPGCQALGPFCGDTVVTSPQEACDDGNDVDNDTCTNACQINIGG